MTQPHLKNNSDYNQPCTFIGLPIIQKEEETPDKVLWEEEEDKEVRDIVIEENSS